MHLFSKVNVSPTKVLLLCFAAGFLVRLIPEALALSHPIGFDTVYYAVAMKNGVVWANWASVFTSTWLLYSIIMPIYGVLGGDPFMVLKLIAPILFGLNVAGVYWFSHKMLCWGLRMSLGAAGFFAIQLAALRISWDLLRNTLGLALLLFTLPLIGKTSTKRGFAGFVMLSLLTVFAHEYAAVTLLVVVLGILAWRLVKRHLDPIWKKLMVAVIPAVTVFAGGIFLRLIPIGNVVASNVIGAGDVATGNVAGIFFIVDYLRVKSAVDQYATYGNLVFSVLVLFAVLYLSYLALVLKGFFRSEVLDLWTGLLLIGAFGCLIIPFFALEYWHRWMFMLVYPFTFYAVNGLKKVGVLDGLKVALKRPSWSHARYKLMVLATVVLGSAYLATPLLMSYSNVNVSSVTNTPAYFSTTPTVPYQDVDATVAVMRWLDKNLTSDSAVLLQHAFLAWGEIYLDKSHSIVQFEVDVEKAISTALQRGFSRVLFVWWNVDIGWYGVKVPEGFMQIFSVDRISVYQYAR